MLLYSKNIYFPNQIKREGYLELEDGIIKNFYKELPQGADYKDYSDYHVIPGFIDQHLHGWGTGSYNNDPSGKAVRTMEEQLPSVGVTSFLATSGATTLDDVYEGIKSTGEILNTQKPGDGATCLGVHLEGPFVNEKRAGMMNVSCFLEPTVEVMQSFIDAQVSPRTIKLMTMAPELEGSLPVIKLCKQEGVQINIGHSDATFEEIAELKEYGLGGVTHMFSGMRGFHHRELGVAGAALHFDDLYCEFAKQTGWTVKPEAFAMAYKLKGPDRIIMTTDNGALALAEKERYHYTRKETLIPNGDFITLRHDDGSEITYNRTNYEEIKDIELSYIGSIRNLIKNVRPSIHDIIKITASNCARYLGIEDRKGSIELGKDADLLVVDDHFNLKATYCMGVLSYMEDDNV